VFATYFSSHQLRDLKNPGLFFSPEMSAVIAGAGALH
jgi:hypothetical protein